MSGIAVSPVDGDRCDKPTSKVDSIAFTPSLTLGVKSIGELHNDCKNANRSWRGVYMPLSRDSLMVMKFLSDLLILDPAICRWPV